MNPVSFSFEARPPAAASKHVDVTVRVGTEGSRALAGTLSMRRYEWDLLRCLLDGAASDLAAHLDSLPTDELYCPLFARDHYELDPESGRRVTVNVRRLIPVADAPITVTLPTEPEIRSWHLLVCHQCEPAAEMPFESQEERGRWAAAHTEGTGHNRWSVWSELRESEPDTGTVIHHSV